MKANKILNPTFILLALSTGLLLWFIIAFIVLPNAEVLVTTFFQDGSLSLEAIHKITSSERAVQALKNSFLIAITLPILTSLVGILQVLFIEYFEIKGSKFLFITYLIPLVFGGLLINNGYLFVYGSNGIVTNILLNFFPNLDPAWFTGYGAVMLVMTFGCTTNYMIFFRNALRQIDFYSIEAAKNLGASQFTVLKDVVLPQLRPIISTCIILLFQQGLGAMAAPLIVGGEDFESISPLILILANRSNSRDLAAILALILGFTQIVLLFVMQRNEKKGHYLSISKTKAKFTKQQINIQFVKVVSHIFAYVFSIIHLLPFVAVILFSFTDYQTIASGQLTLSSFTLSNYARIIFDPDAYSPLMTSIVYAGLSSLVVAIVTIFVARMIHKYNNKFTTMIEYLLHIPWLLPAILFSLGLVITYGSPKLLVFNQILTGTWIIMLIAYIVVMLPNTLRFTKAAFFSVDQNLEEAAANLGASKFYTFFKIVLPFIIPTSLALFALNFNGKLADYDLSAFLYHPLNPTLGIVIRSNADPTAAIDAEALNLVYSVILIAINAFVVWLVYFEGFGKITRIMRKLRGKGETKAVIDMNQVQSQ
ncbi:ABC transporter permease subunit [Carnobacterium sp. PL17RED31]|nr:ABC transporter permease subunit [Carnobacterium sp. PL17RED31]